MSPVKFDAQALIRIQNELQEMAKKARDLAAVLERGQGETPVTGAFESLLEMNSEEPLGISYCPFSAPAKWIGLQWLLEKNSAELQSTFLSSESCNIWEMNSGLGVPIRMFIPSSLTPLIENGAIYQKFCGQGDLILIVALGDHRFTEDELGFLSETLPLFGAIWPLVIEVDGAQNSGWEQLEAIRSHGANFAPTYCIATSVGGADQLAERTGVLHQSLVLLRHARCLAGAFESLVARREREEKQNNLRRQALDVQWKQFGGRRNARQDRKDWEEIGELFSKTLSRAERKLIADNELATQTLGSLSNTLREIVSRVKLDDLEMETTSSTLKMRVNASHLSRVTREVSQAVHSLLNTDVKFLRSQVEGAIQDAESQLRKSNDLSIKLTPPIISEADLWRSMQDMISIGKEAAIELPRRGFFDLLTAGRQKVFILIMFGSLFGRMGLGSLSQFASPSSKSEAVGGVAASSPVPYFDIGFGLFLLGVMIASMVTALFRWRGEKDSKASEELGKIRETLYAEGSKVVEQTQRSKLNQFKDYVREANEQCARQIEALGQSAAKSRKEREDSAEEKLEQNRKQLELRGKALSDIGQQIGKLQPVAQDAQSQVALHLHHTLGAYGRHDPTGSSNSTSTTLALDAPSKSTTPVASNVGNDGAPTQGAVLPSKSALAERRAARKNRHK